jgi:hypothetical protein
MGTPEDVAAEKYFTPPELEIQKHIIHAWEKRIHHGPPTPCNYWDCANVIKDGETCYLELYPEEQCMTFCLDCAATFMAQAIGVLMPVAQASRGADMLIHVNYDKRTTDIYDRDGNLIQGYA